MWDATLYLRFGGERARPFSDLPGEGPVLEWYKGTGLRPVLAALDAEQASDFLAEYGTRLREAYPPGPFGTFFPFRRVFAVAHRIP